MTVFSWRHLRINRCRMSLRIDRCRMSSLPSSYLPKSRQEISLGEVVSPTLFPPHTRKRRATLTTEDRESTLSWETFMYRWYRIKKRKMTLAQWVLTILGHFVTCGGFRYPQLKARYRKLSLTLPHIHTSFPLLLLRCVTHLYNFVLLEIAQYVPLWEWLVSLSRIPLRSTEVVVFITILFHFSVE